MPEGLETAVAIVLTELSSELSALHAEFDPDAAARQIPLHITLLYPFVPRPALTEEVISDLHGFFSEREPLSFALTRVDEFPGVLYAAPEPAEPLREVIEALGRAFPETPPYGGAFAEPVPHATLAEVAAGEEQAQLGAALRRRAQPLLPVRCEVDHASLLEEHESDRWRERMRLPLSTS